uniref:Uncharacterized protein n=1 Tax=Aplanochytrium stocchinoi TaxID=215587 RepID=A0A7S3PJH1_9STRA
METDTEKSAGLESGTQVSVTVNVSSTSGPDSESNSKSEISHFPQKKKRRIQLLQPAQVETNPNPTSPCSAEKGNADETKSKTLAATRMEILDYNKLALPTLRIRKLPTAVTFQFQHTPRCETRRVDTETELRSLFAAETARAWDRKDSWVRHPKMKWIADMINELKVDADSDGSNAEKMLQLNAARRKLETATLTEDDFLGRWAESQELANVVLKLWFEGKSLQDVIQRSKELGHMDEGMVSGCVLHGNSVQRLLSKSQNIDFDTLLPMVKKMSKNRKVSLYKVSDENIFNTVGGQSVGVDDIKTGEGQGSLNTTWDCSEDFSGIDLLDSYHGAIDEFLYSADKDLLLNNLMYLIWKFQNYATAYHQDTHVPPHYTLYSQISGVSVFHFLPILVGLYVTHVGNKDALRLTSILQELDELKIGSVATVGPGQVALILPFGSHGVWVPSNALNPSFPKFETSVIRAAELYIKPLYDEFVKVLAGERWNEVLDVSDEEKAMLSKFREAQDSLRKEMGLSLNDWHWLAKKVLSQWEALEGTQSRKTAD